MQVWGGREKRGPGKGGGVSWPGQGRGGSNAEWFSGPGQGRGSHAEWFSRDALVLRCHLLKASMDKVQVLLQGGYYCGMTAGKECGLVVVGSVVGNVGCWYTYAHEYVHTDTYTYTHTANEHTHTQTLVT